MEGSKSHSCIEMFNEDSRGTINEENAAGSIGLYSCSLKWLTERYFKDRGIKCREKIKAMKRTSRMQWHQYPV